MGRDALGQGFFKKPTRWMTNSRVVAEVLQQNCSDESGGKEWRRHVHLVNGLKGTKKHMEKDGERRDIHSLDGGQSPDEEYDFEEYTDDMWKALKTLCSGLAMKKEQKW